MAVNHVIEWRTAAPLWTAPGNGAAIHSPALLRFGSDSFMDDLTGLLQTSPANLTNLVAKPESFRMPPVGADPNWQPLPPNPPLKLFQPVHGNFYLVAASLVCRVPGLPDRAVNAAQAEKAAFVLRRLDANGEQAWITVPPGSKGWQPLTTNQAGKVAPGEELLPLFPVPYTANGHRRRLLAGLVPTSSRESFQAASQLSPIQTEGDPRLDEYTYRIGATLQALRDSLPQKPPILPLLPPTTPPNPSPFQLDQDATMALLLDFADFLNKQRIDVLGSTAPGPAAPAHHLYTWLETNSIDGTTTWRQALQDAWTQRNQINGEDPTPPQQVYNLRNNQLYTLDLKALQQAVVDALGTYTPPPPAPSPVLVPKLDPTNSPQYVLRCIYQRPRCGPLHPDVVSDPSQPFILAPYFDPDAPSRPVRIPLPVDTSIAGLRKFAKNVAFLTSNKLRGQVNSVSDLKKLLNGELASGDSPTLGEICSFSLPIITLCAMIVLIIFIILLNIAFWWLPFFRLCFPIPMKK